MKAVFADTFYWAALTNTDDAAHERAMVLSRSLAPDKIITTDELFCEYLAFCAGARPSVRAEAGRIVADVIEDMAVRVVPQSRESFLCSGDPSAACARG